MNSQKDSPLEANLESQTVQEIQPFNLVNLPKTKTMLTQIKFPVHQFASQNHIFVRKLKKHGEFQQLNEYIEVVKMDEWIEQNNKAKWDSYFLPNFGGQKDEEIVQINALFIDVDLDDAEKQSRKEAGLTTPVDHIPLPEFHIPPSMIVRSGSGGFHAYWFLASNQLTGDDFRTAQKRLAQHYNSDPIIYNPSRIMRLPGAINHKPLSDDPNATNLPTCFIVELNENRYQPEQILEGIAELTTVQKQRRTIEKISKVENSPVEKVNEFADVLKRCIQATGKLKSEAKEGSRNQSLHSTSVHCFSLLTATRWQDSEHEELGYAAIRDLLFDAGIFLGLDEQEANRAIESASQSKVAKLGTKLYRKLKGTGMLQRTVAFLDEAGYANDIWLNLSNDRMYVGNQTVSDSLASRLATEMFNADQRIEKKAKQYLRSEPDMKPAIIHLANNNPKHPFKDYLAELEAKEDIEAWNEVMEFYGLDELARDSVRLLLHQAVLMLLDHRFIPKIAGVIISKTQSTGKTGFIRQLFHISDVCCCYQGSFPDIDRKDSILNPMGSSVYLVDEAKSALTVRNIEATKAMITQRDFKDRIPFDKFPNSFNREWTLILTSNERDIVSDPTGNSRLLPIYWSEEQINSRYSDKEISSKIDNLRDRLFSDALYLASTQPQIRVTEAMKAMMESSESKYQRDGTDEILNAVEQTIIRPNTDLDSWILTQADIRKQVEMESNLKVSAQTIQYVMKMNGFTFHPNTRQNGFQYRNAFKLSDEQKQKYKAMIQELKNTRR